MATEKETIVCEECEKRARAMYGDVPIPSEHDHERWRVHLENAFKLPDGFLEGGAQGGGELETGPDEWVSEWSDFVEFKMENGTKNKARIRYTVGPMPDPDPLLETERERVGRELHKAWTDFVDALLDTPLFRVVEKLVEYLGKTWGP